MSVHDHDPSSLVRGRVAKVYETYAVAFPLESMGDLTPRDSVTFSLDTWHGSETPQHAQIVTLVNPMLYMRGWRAREAYPVTPVTQHQARSKK